MVIREMPIFVLSHKNSAMLEGEGQMARGDGGRIKYEKTLQIIGLVTEGIKQPLTLQLTFCQLNMPL